MARVYFLFLFLISPLSSWLFISLKVVFGNFKNHDIKSFVFISCCILSFINTLKVPESDLINYVDDFNSIFDYGFIEYLILKGKEPLFYASNYIIFHLSNGSEFFFIFIYSFISYIFILNSLCLLQKLMKFDDYFLFFGLLILMLFPNLFSISAHLIRQFLASSMILLALMRYVAIKKSPFVLLVAASLTHSTSLVFFLMYLPLMSKEIKVKNYFNLLLIVFIIYMLFNIFFDKIIALFSSVPFVNYIILRMANKGQGIELESIGYLGLLLFLLNILLFLVVLKRYKYNGLNLIFNLILFLTVFVLLNYQNTELALRFGFYLYFFFPISLYLFVGTVSFFNKKLLFNISLLFIIIFEVWFIFKLFYGTWEYRNLEYLILYLPQKFL
ncbi:EpsG family protein [Belliella sp. R4-6]|uniref:EpsG family protein n=1 Tax=Belliella alkalica TaxID=1730871 RepID=A0ABS9VDY4_9BACT|nr:EpsG family protein [Belliella alkalica]MCH7414627.1 EpsG family protein [Belliella alkalica]